MRIIQTPPLDYYLHNSSNIIPLAERKDCGKREALYHQW